MTKPSKDIAVRYATTSNKVAVDVLITWGVVGLAFLWMLLTYFKASYAAAMLWLAPFVGTSSNFFYVVCTGLVVVAAFLLYVWVPFLVSASVQEGGRLVVSEAGLGFPPGLFGLGQPRWYPWKDLKTVRVQDGTEGKKVILHFGSKQVVIEQSKLEAADLERVLIGVEVWAKAAEWENAAIEFKDGLQNENRGLTGVSYSRLWQDELERHFTSTVFTPRDPGSKLRNGAFKIIRQIAFGGFSAIYLAEDGIGNQVVIKEFVPPANASDEVKQKASKMFERESAILYELSNEHIAKVIDTFVQDGRSYLALEYVSGPNLRQLIKWKGPLPEESVVNLANQMAAMLQYLHQRDLPIVHRDFTPDNLVLRDDGQLMLIDFGAANTFIGTATGTLVGKQAYMAPEQIKGKSVPASDIYSLGGTLHFLLTGKDPEALSSCHPAEKTRVSLALDALVASATSLDSSKRPTASDLASELLRLSKGGESMQLNKLEELGA